MMGERLITTAIASSMALFTMTAVVGIFTAGNEPVQTILQPIGAGEAVLVIGLILIDALRIIWSRGE